MKIYFASDFHLGAPNEEESAVREKRIVSWLDEIKVDAKEIYLTGDLFDFWFEYKYVVPKGYVRFFGKIAELTDSGIPVHFFIGNHDMWMNGYLEEEIGLKIHYEEFIINENNQQIFIGHGDGLGKGDYSYKLENRNVVTDSLDEKIIIDAKALFDNKQKIQLTYNILNTDRALGTRLSSEVTRKIGMSKLPDDYVFIRMRGSAGQSLGAFIAKGITLEVFGDANDYVGKGLSGGKIIVRPKTSSTLQDR